MEAGTSCWLNGTSPKAVKTKKEKINMLLLAPHPEESQFAQTRRGVGRTVLEAWSFWELIPSCAGGPIDTDEAPWQQVVSRVFQYCNHPNPAGSWSAVKAQVCLSASNN